jgi:plasmid stability protein
VAPQDSDSRDLDKVIVRLPNGMRDRLKAAAAENNRSMNAEIVARLEESFSYRQEAQIAFAQMIAGELDHLLDRTGLAATATVLPTLHKIGAGGTTDEEAVLLLSKARIAISDALNKAAETTWAGAIEEVLPRELSDRIHQAAAISRRQFADEVIFALEEAYPPPVSLPGALSSLGTQYLVLHRQLNSWVTVDWDDWVHFRSGRDNQSRTIGTRSAHEYYVVAVFDENGDLVNAIRHNYRVAENGTYHWAALDLLSEDERADYQRLMTIPAFAEGDEERLAQLQEKMAPALELPQEAVSSLRAALAEIARTPESVDAVFARWRS